MGRECKVLVVDDEPLIRPHLVQILEEDGCKTLVAGSVANAIDVSEHNPGITVVFTDIQMPGSMDGIALAAYVRNRWPSTMIVLCSGVLQDKSDEFPAGVQFISKPYADGHVTQVISEIQKQLIKN